MIEVITGLPGFGKTLTATNWAYKKYIKKGKKVYANYPLKGSEYIHDVYEILGKVSDCLIVVDEAGIVFDQLRMYNLPDHVWMELRQHRKDAVNLLCTAQSMLDIAYPMRRLIQFEWNIYFKLGRFVSVTCRNPQPRGDNYGKYIWHLSKDIFSLYDTSWKVTEDMNAEEKKDDLYYEDLIMNKYISIQDEMMLGAYRKSNISNSKLII